MDGTDYWMPESDMLREGQAWENPGSVHTVQNFLDERYLISVLDSDLIENAVIDTMA